MTQYSIEVDGLTFYVELPNVPAGFKALSVVILDDEYLGCGGDWILGYAVEVRLLSKDGEWLARHCAHQTHDSREAERVARACAQVYGVEVTDLTD